MKTLQSTVRRLVQESINRQVEALPPNSILSNKLVTAKTKFENGITRWMQKTIKNADTLYRRAADDDERKYAIDFLSGMLREIQNLEGGSGLYGPQ